MTEVQANLAEGATELGVGPEQFRLLPDAEGEAVYRRALAEFVVGVRFEPRWWWEHLREPRASWYPHPTSYEHALEVVPDPDASVLFIPEDDTAPFYPAYATTPRVAVAVLGASYAPDEFYLVAPDFAWLLGQNHHDVFFGVGEPVISALRARADTRSA